MGIDVSKFKDLADNAHADYEEFLELAKEQAPDGTYREGTPEFENLTEAYTSLGIATGLRFIETVPLAEYDDSEG